MNLIAFASAATLATGIRIQSSVHASAEHGCAFYGAGLAAAAYLLVSHAARESKGEFQVQASKYDSPALPCPRVPRSRPYENDKSLPGWHLDGICVAAYEPHIGLLKA